MQLRLVSLIATAALAIGLVPASAQEWTRFHGPNGTGESETTTIPASWTDKDLNWKVELPGIGHSSPVLWGEKIFLLSADPKTATRYVLCQSATNGKELWRREYPGVLHKLNLKSSYASCTPACDGERVYVAWSDPASTRLLAFDHAGNEKWNIDLGPWMSQHGFGTSPMLYGDLVVMLCSQESSKRAGDPEPTESFVVAVDKATGKIRWRTPRETHTACYSVPCVRKNEAGENELVCCTTKEGIFALDPKTGRQNWSAADVFTLRTVSSPLLAGDLVLGSTGQGAGGHYVVAVRPGREPQVAYEIRQQAPYVPTPVKRGELLFLFEDRQGHVTCVNASDGKVQWRQERVASAFYACPVRAGDKLFCIDEKGTVVCLAASQQFQELGRSELGEECRSTPAIAGGRMYIRSISHLMSVGGK